MIKSLVLQQLKEIKKPKKIANETSFTCTIHKRPNELEGNTYIGHRIDFINEQNPYSKIKLTNV